MIFNIPRLFSPKTREQLLRYEQIMPLVISSFFPELEQSDDSDIIILDDPNDLTPLAAPRLCKLERQHQEGHPLAVWDALLTVLSYKVPAPEWLENYFVAAIGRILVGKSADDVFFRSSHAGRHANTLTKYRELAWSAFIRLAYEAPQAAGWSKRKSYEIATYILDASFPLASVDGGQRLHSEETVKRHSRSQYSKYKPLGQDHLLAIAGQCVLHYVAIEEKLSP